MLKFNEWPPRAGQVEFAPDIALVLANEMNRESARQMGQYMVSLLHANMTTPNEASILHLTDELLDSSGIGEANVQAITAGVSEGLVNLVEGAEK